MGAAVEGFAPDHPNEIRILLEEPEAGRDDEVNLLPPLHLFGDRTLHPGSPLLEGDPEHLGVDRLLRREMMQETRTTQAHRSGDVVQRRAVVTVVGETPPRLDDDRVPRRERGFGGCHSTSP